MVAPAADFSHSTTSTTSNSSSSEINSNRNHIRADVISICIAAAAISPNSLRLPPRHPPRRVIIRRAAIKCKWRNRLATIRARCRRHQRRRRTRANEVPNTILSIRSTDSPSEPCRPFASRPLCWPKSRRSSSRRRTSASSSRCPRCNRPKR